MRRKLSVLAIGVVTFLVVTASAASLGTNTVSASLSAGTATVSGCGSPGAISVSYGTIVESSVTKVDTVILTADNTTNSNPWSSGTTTCLGKSAKITLGAQSPETITVPLVPTGAYNQILTFDLVTNIDVTLVSNFSIVIQG